MTDLASVLSEIASREDAVTVSVTRGELRNLFERLYCAEGMNVRQAEIHARMIVEGYIARKAALDTGSIDADGDRNND